MLRLIQNAKSRFLDSSWSYRISQCMIATSFGPTVTVCFICYEHGWLLSVAIIRDMASMVGRKRAWLRCAVKADELRLARHLREG